MKYKDILKNNPFTISIILFSTLISGISFYYSKWLALVELIIIILLSVFTLRWISNSVDRKKTELRCIEASLAESGEMGEYTLNFPFPFILVTYDGHIEWFNSDFEKILDEFETKDGHNILNFVPEASRFLYNGDFSSFDLRTQKSDYTVYPTQIEDNLFSIYFVEDTVLKKTAREFEITRPAVLLINVDSLDQTEDSLAHADYYSVISDVEREITKWLVENKCVFRKFADGKFFAVTEKKHIDEMAEKKFDILDKIRLYRYSEIDMDITLSIGVGRENRFVECEASARLALDMARGRGGDQVALKMGDNYEFFGGITARKEKRGKIKSRVHAATLDEYINNSSQVFVMGHSFSDFDAIGAAVGVAAIAKSCDKQVHIVVNKKNTLSMPLINIFDESDNVKFISPESAYLMIDSNSLLVITDTMRANLLDAPAIFDKAGEKVIIDHHRMTVDHISTAALLFHEPYASSACEMVTELVQYAPSNPKLSKHEAEALLAGIILDTKNFTLRVGTRTFEAAAYLKDNKADTVSVHNLFAGSVKENVNVSKLITSAEFHGNYAVVSSENNPEITRLIASKTADELLNIEGVDASFVITSDNKKVSVSARSLGRINVQLIMEKFGGGGHQSMAACQIEGITADEAKKQVIKAVQEYKNNNS